MISVEQQALLTIRRVRQGFIVERTAIINRLRGLLSESGVVLPLRSVNVRRQAAEAAEVLPMLAKRAINDLLDQLRVLDGRIGGYDREIEAQAKLSDAAKRLMQIRGRGPTTALAIVATVGNAREFKNGRQFAAWIGLVPGQTSTGGKTRHDCQIDDDETVKPAPGNPDQTRRQLQRPTNERGPGVRLSSGPGHSMPANRPVIVTQSVLLSSVK